MAAVARRLTETWRVMNEEQSVVGYLVVASTLGGTRLRETLRNLAEDDGIIHVVVSAATVVGGSFPTAYQ